MKRETKTDVTEQLYDLLGSVILILKFRTFNEFQFVFSVTQFNYCKWMIWFFSNFWFFVELVSKELNHLAAILHVYAGGLNFMK